MSAKEDYEPIELAHGEQYGMAFDVMCEEIDRLRQQNELLRSDLAGVRHELSVAEEQIEQEAEEARKFQLLWQQALEFNQRLMKELSQHGWGDFHYGPQEQDRNIVALLEEGGFQFDRVETIDINTEPNVFEREQSTLETRPGSGRDDGTGTTDQETV